MTDLVAFNTSCECCTRRFMLATYVATIEGRAYKVLMCSRCAKDGHAPQACLKCYMDNEVRIVAWDCQRVAHAVEFHPGLVANRVNRPDDPEDSEGPYKHLGSVPI